MSSWMLDCSDRLVKIEFLLERILFGHDVKVGTIWMYTGSAIGL